MQINLTDNASIPIVQELQTTSVIPPSQVQFWTLLLFVIPSLACTIFLLYQLLRDRHLRQGLHNHVIIILLMITLGIEISDASLYIDANRMGGVRNSFTMVPSICVMWWLFDYGAYGAISVFLAWGSIERHILVFHERQLLRTARQRFFVHHLPLIILSAYLTGFYVGVILFPPCENVYDYESVGCGLSPCYRDVPYLNLWDYILHGIASTLIETGFSIGLLARVFWQRRRARRPLNWRKHRKMAFQLLSISCLSSSVALPLFSIVVIRQVGGPSVADFGADIHPYLSFLYAFTVLLFPLICLASLPELWPKLWLPHRHEGSRISPMAMTATAGRLPNDETR